MGKHDLWRNEKVPPESDIMAVVRRSTIPTLRSRIYTIIYNGISTW